jgi:hypothetical protein
VGGEVGELAVDPVQPGVEPGGYGLPQRRFVEAEWQAVGSAVQGGKPVADFGQ